MVLQLFRVFDPDRMAPEFLPGHLEAEAVYPLIVTTFWRGRAWHLEQARLLAATRQRRVRKHSAAEAAATAGVAAGAQAEAADVDSRPEHAPDAGARMTADDDEDGDAESAPEEQEDPLEDLEDWVAVVADALSASNAPAEVADIHVEEGGGWSDEADSDQDCVVWVPFSSLDGRRIMSSKS